MRAVQAVHAIAVVCRVLKVSVSGFHAWRRRPPSKRTTSDAEQRLAAVMAEMDRVAAERDQYKKLYLEMLELCRKLERGIVGPKREKLSPGDAQLTMSLLGMLHSTLDDHSAVNV